MYCIIENGFERNILKVQYKAKKKYSDRFVFAVFICNGIDLLWTKRLVLTVHPTIDT